MPSSLKNLSSSQIVIPRSCALVSLLPASCPAITTSVFLETEPAQFPPKNSIFSLASSRVMESSVPVSTKVRPVNITFF